MGLIYQLSRVFLSDHRQLSGYSMMRCWLLCPGVEPDGRFDEISDLSSPSPFLRAAMNTSASLGLRSVRKEMKMTLVLLILSDS